MAKRLVARRNDRLHLARRRRTAETLYARLRSATGRPDLDAATSRRIREYAAESLGSPAFAPWLRLFTLTRGTFLEGWIPEDFYVERVVPGLYAGRTPVREKRTLSRRLLGSDAFPDLAYRVNGRWFTPDYAPVGDDELLDLVFAHGDEVILKPEGTARGEGVRRVGPGEFATAVRAWARNGAVQRPLVQHAALQAIYPHAVATVRVTTTYLDDAGPRFRAACLKVGSAGAVHVAAATYLKCVVTDMQGTLADHAAGRMWVPHARHPDTGFAFAGARIPAFAEAVATCLGLHARLPHDPLVGWDVTVTDAGEIAVMEWNSGNVGVSYSEAALGPLFADCGFERFARRGPG